MGKNEKEIILNNIFNRKSVGTYTDDEINKEDLLFWLSKTPRERISAVEKMVAPIDEKFAIDATATAAAPRTSFTLTQKPNDVLVKAIINHTKLYFIWII